MSLSPTTCCLQLDVSWWREGFQCLQRAGGPFCLNQNLYMKDFGGRFLTLDLYGSVGISRVCLDKISCCIKWLPQAPSFIRFHHHVTSRHCSLQVSGLGSPLCHDSHGVPIDLSAPVPLQHQVQQTAGGEDTRWPSSVPGLPTGLSQDKSPHPNTVRVCFDVFL